MSYAIIKYDLEVCRVGTGFREPLLGLLRSSRFYGYFQELRKYLESKIELRLILLRALHKEQ